MRVRSHWRAELTSRIDPIWTVCARFSVTSLQGRINLFSWTDLNDGRRVVINWTERGIAVHAQCDPRICGIINLHQNAVRFFKLLYGSCASRCHNAASICKSIPIKFQDLEFQRSSLRGYPLLSLTVECCQLYFRHNYSS
jgi:hypothetical protein